MYIQPFPYTNLPLDISTKWPWADASNDDLPKPKNCCKAFGCNTVVPPFKDFCEACVNKFQAEIRKLPDPSPMFKAIDVTKPYSIYFKDVRHLDEIDVYAVHQVFNILDPSGAIHHASKKLLLSGVRTGGKSKYKDIKEARDSLNRWLELNPEPATVL